MAKKARTKKKAAEPTDDEVFDLVVDKVFSDCMDNDPDVAASELELDWSDKNANRWDQIYQRCEMCEQWCECGELVNELGDVVPCPGCHDANDLYDEF